MKHTISIVRLAGILCMALAAPVGSIQLWAQGETTSAITGQVSDTSGGAVARVTVTITHRGTGLRRQVQTDESGRFAFPQLHPGPYSMRVQAPGFDEQVNESVSAGLGESRTVNFTLKVVAAKQDITVGSEVPLINVEGANTTTTITGRAIQDLPNPGCDLTYPAQFAPGALIDRKSTRLNSS